MGWLIGVVLLWLSDVWSTRDKVLGTLVVPGGLVAPMVVALFPIGRATACVTQQRADGTVVSTCTDGGVEVLWLLVLAALVVAPILVAIHLGRSLRRARALADRWERRRRSRPAAADGRAQPRCSIGTQR